MDPTSPRDKTYNSSHPIEKKKNDGRVLKFLVTVVAQKYAVIECSGRRIERPMIVTGKWPRHSQTVIKASVAVSNKSMYDCSS